MKQKKRFVTIRENETIWSKNAEAFFSSSRSDDLSKLEELLCNSSPGSGLKTLTVQKNFFRHMKRPRSTEIITENAKMVSNARGVSLRGRSATFIP